MSFCVVEIEEGIDAHDAPKRLLFIYGNIEKKRMRETVLLPGKLRFGLIFSRTFR
jgi:hypothetical protein